MWACFKQLIWFLKNFSLKSNQYLKWFLNEWVRWRELIYLITTQVKKENGTFNLRWLDYLLGSYQAKVKVDWTLTGISKEESTNIPFSLLFVDQECSLFLKATCVPSYTTISSFKPGKAIKYIAVHLLPLRASELALCPWESRIVSLIKVDD